MVLPDLNKNEFFQNVLKRIGAPVTNNGIAFLNQWANNEKRAYGKPHGFNPLNTTKDIKEIDPGQTVFNSVGVKNYSTQNAGEIATAKTLLLPYYKTIVKVLKQGLPPSQAFKTPGINQELKTWGTHTFAAKFTTKPQVKTAKGNTFLIVFIICIAGYLIYKSNAQS